jgi:hypothetical protein
MEAEEREGIGSGARQSLLDIPFTTLQMRR